MITEADIQLLKSRVNELEDRLNLLYRRLNIEYTDPNADPLFIPPVLIPSLFRAAGSRRIGAS